MGWKQHLVASSVLLTLDWIWFRYYSKRHYNRLVKRIQGTGIQPHPIPSIAAALCMVIGLNLFLVGNYATVAEGLPYAIAYGAIQYGAFNFMAASLLKAWDYRLAFVDIIWGALVFSLSLVATILV